MSTRVPQGFRLGGMYCGIKRDKTRLDLSLIVSDRPAVAAGVYTQNLVFAAPVAWDRGHTPGDGFRAVVINSGNANACTGERGLADVREMAALAGKTCGATADQVLVLSTGIIGEFLPLATIAAGIDALQHKLASDEPSLVAAARGMMTTDTVEKIASRTVDLVGRSVQITGMCKGAAMIGPNMATLLGLVLTDAALDPAEAQAILSEIIDDTFNCISVDGHMSTNDTVLLLANGASGVRPSGEGLKLFREALHHVCDQLSRKIPQDGEGATHLIGIHVSGCASRAEARQIAKTVADSPLVKTAIAGADPNWGRIVSAAGYSGVKFDPAKVNLKVNGHALYRAGAPLPFSGDEVSAAIQNSRDTTIDLSFGEGQAAITYWTTDLTAEYVRLNADYHT